MTNAVILPLDTELELVIASDNSGSIGEKKDDFLKTSNEIVGLFACRVALMEILAEYAEPRAVIMQNFTDDKAWSDYEKGVIEVLAEADFAELPITGSTESNFASLQSGLGLTIIGTREKRAAYNWTGKEQFAVIGIPLVGNAVLENRNAIAPISLLKQFTEMAGVKAVLPVGSKGVKRTFQRWKGKNIELESEVDLETSAGPATCFIAAFDSAIGEDLSRIAGTFFHPVKVVRE